MDARTGGNMTVKELIAKLQEFPDFMNVKISLIDVDLLEVLEFEEFPTKAKIITEDINSIDVERTDISEITISAIGC
ncbi:phage protein [Streptococcus pyogenes]|uniref:Phage protein n=3 Tax=Streptococcus pyogenes TaxID=1314 RepID=A0A7G1J3T4_STRPY|nr:hypothetical protein [Streptococcus pyogenes]EZK69691.1 hypothetical protein Z477_01234 [Streptococcus pyogenes ABC020044412]EZK78604.1 hypothetical protein Z447_01249 [Streptococcus pyogenes ABC020025676]EZK83500.1 hypothetical protein Z429_01234 [Streptococcus pyogenes ABC020015292]EZK93091.1 hypothetical protein Z423_01237 [Streptococcus pyogenes ABC020013551]EZL01395.1 hypothetical protein Z415_00972 [Streptococcus pyogenes ABC020006298]EZL76193.1 hypothetical protein Z293_01239 [Strep